MGYPAPAPRAWGSPVEIERRRRIMVAVYAYAYEYLDESLVDDHTFDAESLKINQNMDTDNAELDAFFRSEFWPDSGVWVHQHPNKKRLEQIAKSIIADRKKKKPCNNSRRVNKKQSESLFAKQ